MYSSNHRSTAATTLIRLACLGALCSGAAGAQAQTAPDPALQQRRLQEREDAQRQQLEARPDVHLPSGAAKALSRLPERESPCFPIRSVHWNFEDADRPQLAGWQSWLDRALAGAEGDDSPLNRCIGGASVGVLRERAQNALMAHGYTTSNVIVPEQDLSGGELALTVVAGRIHAIRLAEPMDPRVHLDNALPMRPGDVLYLRDIEQALENLKRVPTAEADIQIEPARALAGEAPTGPAQSDLVIRYQQGLPWRLSLSADDSGTKTTGKYQGSATVSYDNPLTLNDLFYLTLNHDLGGGVSGARGTHGYTAHYDIPWGYWLLGFTGAESRYYQSVAGANGPIVYAGNSGNAEVALSRIVQRDALGKTTLSLKAWQKSTNNFIDDTEVLVQRRVEGGWELGAQRSQAIGSANLDAKVSYKRGTGAFGSLTAPEEAFGEGTSRFGLISADVNLNAPFQWGEQKVRYVGEWRAQFNRTPLTPQDRFAIGGRYTVRGFDGEQQLSAEHGWLWRNELAFAIGSSGQELYAGLDHGVVGGPSAQSLVGATLTGAVVGLRGSVAKTQYDLFVGAPVAKPQGFTTSTWTAGFSINWSI